jgi:hypothetical protein
MKEILISFETAKLAKEKGFKLGIGWHGFEDWFYEENGRGTANHRGGNLCSPTQSLLQKWLRVEHDIFTQVTLSDHPEGRIYSFCIKKSIKTFPIRETFTKFTEDNWFETYEESLEKVLIESLKLIN